MAGVQSAPVAWSARLANPVLNGRLGSSPLHVQAAGGQLIGQQFGFDRFGMQLGTATSPVLFDAARLTGSFAGSLHGNFSGATGSIGKVPLLISDAVGSWLYRNKDLTVNSALTVSDKDPNPRFYPLRSDNTHFTIAGDYVRATGALHLPANGALITDVSIEHQLSTGEGHATLDVPGLGFGPNFQPEQLSRLTEGVVALVNGTVSGQGRIQWGAGGKVTSTGDFSTLNMDLAAPFGPVTGLSTTMHFTDLLKMETAPHQVATVASINPGIIVSDGVIHYQLLPNNLVRIERRPLGERVRGSSARGARGEGAGAGLSPGRGPSVHVRSAVAGVRAGGVCRRRTIAGPPRWRCQANRRRRR